MPQITFIEYDGTIHEIAVVNGTTIMEAAIDNGVPGIDADCGGQCACATCHVFIKGDWAAKISARSEIEETMLELAREALTEVPTEKRLFFGQTLALDQRRIVEAEALIVEFRARFHDLLSGGTPDGVYHLAIQLFSLTEPTGRD